MRSKPSTTYVEYLFTIKLNTLEHPGLRIVFTSQSNLVSLQFYPNIHKKAYEWSQGDVGTLVSEVESLKLNTALTPLLHGAAGGTLYVEFQNLVSALTELEALSIIPSLN